MAPLIACVGAFADVTELHVSNSDQPQVNGHTIQYSTLSESRDAIRSLKNTGTLPPGGVTVWVHGGAYPLAQSFALDERDSGTVDAPISYRAAENESVVLTGAINLPAGQFGSVTDEAIRKRLDEAARDNVLVADLRAAAITEYGLFPDGFESAPSVAEFFVNGQRQTLARWPNEGWAEIASVIESGPAPWRNYASDALGVFEYSGDRSARWSTAPAVWLQGYWCFDWSIETIRVGAIDSEKRHIRLAKQHHYGIGSGNPAPRRYIALNLLEELDQAGEYFIDRDAGLVYYYPNAPVADSKLAVSILKEPVIDIRNASHLTIRGFAIEETMGAAVRVSGGSHVRIAACTVSNTGLEGIILENGTHHSIEACDIREIGTTGIQASGGDRKTLSSSYHRIVNNDIYNVSQRQRTHAYNLLLGGAGIHVAHNSIHDAPHQAITIGGNDHLIEYNDIYRIGMDSDDCGAFYMGRNPSERGTILRYNYWHDLGSEMAHGSCAIYFDDGAGGQQVYGNVFYRAAGGGFGAVFSHGGHDNLVENNIFIECKRAMGASPWPDAYWEQWLGEPLWQDKLLKEVDITKPPYTERYPELRNFMESGKQPRVNRADRNVIVQCENTVDGNWAIRDSFVYRTDPGFVNAAAKNFGLRDDSIVYKVLPGFVPIPFELIGLRQDELRTALPPKE